MSCKRERRNWHPTIPLLGLAVLMALAATPAAAVTVTFGYTGTITDASGSIAGFPELPYNVGDPIAGSFTFDPYADPWPTPGAGIYYSALQSSTVSLGPITVTQEFALTSASCSPAPDCSLPPGSHYEAWMLVDPSSFDYAGQRFIVETYAFDANFDPLLEFALHLQGIPGSPELDPPVITSRDLPLTPWDPDLFLDTWGEIRHSGTFRAQFSVDDMYLVSVPEPALPLVLCLGAAWIAAHRRLRAH